MGYDHMTELLLNTPIPIDSKDKNERTALHWAAVGGHVEVVKLLIDRKAGLELKDVDDSTPLILAILNDHEAVFKLLVETEQLSLDELDSYGRTPLFLAATHGYEHFVTQLISRGCQIAVTDFYSSTLLHVAVRSGLESLVCILLGSETFELDSEDCLGRTPRWWSRRCGHSAIETLLVDHAISQGIELRDSGEVPRISTADASLKSRPWCDVCTLVIDYDGRYCGCPEGCFQGRLAICSDCYELGARCMDSSHEVDWKVAPRPTES
ncbi:ankyrin [Aspergillus ellipticus CBS 707.79]|uniref:Ankyrin n=1 Tax=Aspergillus ellipticus CBS 707.79 TaxID=1448320 RepID=A0A319D2E0_9EURO|nr:ankyrin [Aspergillus ellipticus CBS 707.79]